MCGDNDNTENKVGSCPLDFFSTIRRAVTKLLQQPSKRLKRSDDEANINLEFSSESESADNDTVHFRATITNNTLVFIQKSVLDPLLTTLDILIWTPIVHTSWPLLIIFLVVRTVLAIIEGALVYVLDEGVDSEHIQHLVTVVNELFNTSKSV